MYTDTATSAAAPALRTIWVVLAARARSYTSKNSALMPQTIVNVMNHL